MGDLLTPSDTDKRFAYGKQNYVWALPGVSRYNREGKSIIKMAPI